MKSLSVTLVVFLLLLIESTVLRFPLLLLFLLVLFVHSKSVSIFGIAFIVGIFLDILTVNRVGLSSLFFITILFLIYLYERKYDTNTIPFVIIASMFIASGYILFIGGSLSFTHIVLSIVTGTLLFLTITFLYPTKNRS